MASPSERTNPIITDSRPLTAPTKRINLTITDSLPILPFELLVEILSRLPVKLLLQLRCLCKSFNSIIFDPYFVRKHVNMSTTRGTHFACYKYQFHIKSYPLESMFTDITTNVTDLGFPFYNNNNSDSLYYIACSCHGILCLPDFYQYTILLCNPSIRKFKKLPPFEKPQVGSKLRVIHGFGYDHVSDHYKVVVLYHWSYSGVYEDTSPMEVKVLTLGTHYWRTIPVFHFGAIFKNETGKCVSGAVNWLAFTEIYPLRQPFIVSFDLAKESFQKFSVPDHGRRDRCNVTLLVWRDCLGIIFDHDVWVMNTYGVEESWVKLFSVSYLQNPDMSSILTKALYICDDQLLLELKEKLELIVYDSKNGTFRVTKFQYAPEVCVESLLTPDII